MTEETRNARKYEPVVHDDIEKYLAAIRFLTVNKIPFSDKTPFGGALWVLISDSASRQIADLEKASGLKFFFSQKGSSSSRNKPAWYYRAGRQPSNGKHEVAPEQPKAQVSLARTPDTKWPWPPADENRVKSALKIPAESVHIDAASECASIDGTPDRNTGEITTHVVTLSRCSCQDFNANNRGEKPCKHMIRLGIELGILNENGLTPEQQRESDIAELRERIARLAGFYYVFDEVLVSDSEYDALKADLSRLVNEAREG